MYITGELSEIKNKLAALSAETEKRSLMMGDDYAQLTDGIMTAEEDIERLVQLAQKTEEEPDDE